MPIPLILDTDIGMDVDDAIALCFAALDPRLDLLAVTTVNGDTKKRAAVARALLRLVGRPEIPVGAGASLPLDGRGHAFMPSNHVDVDPVQALVDEPLPSAHELLTATLEQADAPVTVCAIGALTNLSQCFTARPDLLARVARIQVMGGCLGPYSADGFEGPPFEFNVSCDAAASAVLMGLPVPIGLVPIDVTVHAFFDEADRAAIRSAGRLGRVLDVLMDDFLAFLARLMPQASPRIRLHDPLTVATLVEPAVARFEPCAISVFGPHGACRTEASLHGRPIDRCTSVDNARLTALLVETLVRQDATGTTDAAPRPTRSGAR